MKCRWYAERYNGECFNGSCPYRGGTCPTSEHPEVCKYAEAAPEDNCSVDCEVTHWRPLPKPTKEERER